MSTVLLVLGGIVVFAKLESYKWWLIGNWKGALGVIAVLGLGILLTNIIELVKFVDIPSTLETFYWAVVATITIGCLFSRTTKAEFLTSAGLIGVGWLAQVTRHLWVSEEEHRHHVHFLPAR